MFKCLSQFGSVDLSFNVSRDQELNLALSKTLGKQCTILPLLHAGVHLELSCIWWSNREFLGFEDSGLFLSNFLNYEHDGEKAKLIYQLV